MERGGRLLLIRLREAGYNQNAMEIIPHRLSQEPNQCITASIASLLGLSLSLVPRFNGDIDSVEDWVSGPFSELIGEEWKAHWHFSDPPNGFAVAWGKAANSLEGHCIVVLDGKPWHDPSGCGLSVIDGYITLQPKDDL